MKAQFAAWDELTKHANFRFVSTYNSFAFAFEVKVAQSKQPCVPYSNIGAHDNNYSFNICESHKSVNALIHFDMSIV